MVILREVYSGKENGCYFEHRAEILLYPSAKEVSDTLVKATEFKMKYFKHCFWDLFETCIKMHYERCLWIRFCMYHQASEAQESVYDTDRWKQLVFKIHIVSKTNYYYFKQRRNYQKFRLQCSLRWRKAWDDSYSCLQYRIYSNLVSADLLQVGAKLYKGFMLIKGLVFDFSKFNPLLLKQCSEKWCNTI